MADKKRVLFLCVGNSCRSQIAEGWLRHMASDRFDVYSAGSIAAGLNPNAVKVMAEVGVDVSRQRSKRVDTFAQRRFDYVVTVCDDAHRECPVFLGQVGKRLHWPFEDPAEATGSHEEVVRVFRLVRDQIKARLERFVEEEAKAACSADESTERREAQPRMMTPRIRTETRFVGLPISGGTAVARVCLFNEKRHSNLVAYRVAGEGLEREKNRVRQAIALAANQLDRVVKNVFERIGPAEAQIFEAQKAILADKVLVREILGAIESRKLNAEAAVAQILDAYESRLQEVDNEYLKERASDIGEIRRRLLDVLANMNPSLQCADDQHCQQGRDRIIVAEELTPSLAVELDMDRTLGFVTERGGPTSHAAILARALGIPAVSGIQGIHGLLSCGTELLVDGDAGEVIVWPSEETIAGVKSERRAAVRTSSPVDPVPGLTVMANISYAADVAQAVEQKAEGVGLYRTEFEFFAAGRILSEEEQLERYASVVRAMDGRPVCFRLLDIGGDKPAPFLDLPREDNPYLGFRGSRLLLGRTDLLRAQARALARASLLGPVDVMYPMIVDRDQFLRLKAVFEEATADLPAGPLRHGVMFEVPSACLEARELLETAQFASIGTNDLIQYLFAVDRNNELVADDYTPDRPVFWAVLGQIAAAAQATGRPVSLCGEAASNVRFLPRLLELGLTRLSVSPRFIPELRLAAKQNTTQGRTP